MTRQWLGMGKLHLLMMALGAFICLTLSTVNTHTALAVTAADWSANNIIDDALFYDNTSMSTADIQNFLNSKVSTCDTQGSASAADMGYPNITHAQYAAQNGWPGPPYICLKDYMQVPQSSSISDNYSGSVPSGAISAAQIIKNAADAYGVSPKVILVTLQKESLNLIYDTWPIQNQYKNAMGYGCPDTAPCDPSYAGFYNQVNNAAWQWNYYKQHAYDKDTKGNYIYNQQPYNTSGVSFNPVASCGSTPVQMGNYATTGLYNYTPYQPNQAALSNLYGTGDSCSAYGNRNFWRIYNDWFGSTKASIIRTYEDGAMYLLGASGTYYHITSADELKAIGYGIALNSIYNTSKSYLTNFTNAGDLSTTVRFGGGTNVYLLDSGNKQLYSYSAYTAFGQPPVSNLDESLMSYFYPGPDVTTVVRQYGDSNLYSIQSGKRHYIGGPSVYTSGGYSSINVTPVGNYNFTNILEGAPILSPGTITQTSDTGTMGVVTSDGSGLVTLDTNSAKSIPFTHYVNSSSILNLLTPATAPTITLLAKDGNNNLYLLDGTNKYNLTANQIASLNKTASDFVSVDPSFLNRFTTASITGTTFLLRATNTEPVYIVSNGELIRVETLNDFNQAGFTMSSVANLQANTLSLLFTNNGKTYLPLGALFRNNTSTSIYILDKNNTSHLIPTGDIFNDFGFSYNSVRSINNETFSSLPQGPALQGTVSAPDGSIWAISNNSRSWIDPSLISAYATSPNITPVPSSILNPMVVNQNLTKYIRINQGQTVYYVNNTQKTPLASPQTFAAYGGTNWNQVINVSAPFANILQTQPVAQ